MQGTEYLRAIIIMTIFYSFAITGITHYLPSNVTGTGIFTSYTDSYSVAGLNAEMNNGLSQQLNIPVFDLGSLVYYSGNFFIDLLLNFIFAIPEMLTIFFGGLFFLFGVDPFIANQILIAIKVSLSTSYLIMLITMLLNIRSRTATFL